MANKKTGLQQIEMKQQQADAARITDERETENSVADKARMLAERRGRKLEQIAGDLPDDVNALWLYAEHSLAQSAVSMIDAGRALVKLKEILPHGDFLNGLEDRGVSRMSASRICRSAVTFADRSEKFLKLGRTKLYACLDFSDNELDALEDGQSVLDIDLDKLDRMTTRELKAAIKKRDEDIDAKDKVSADKNAQIQALAEENEWLKGCLATAEDAPAVQTLKSKGMAALADLMMLRGQAQRLRDEGADASPHEVAALAGVLGEFRVELALAFELLDGANPAFQAQLEGAAVDINAWKDGIDIPADMQAQ